MSTETDTRIDVDVDLNIKPQCEWPTHSGNKHAHDDGPARWRITSKCPGCGRGSVRLACDRRAKWYGLCYCLEDCGFQSTALEFTIRIERI